MKINLYEFLTNEQQNEIFEIIKELKIKIKNKEITKNDAYLEIRYGNRFKNWLDSIEDIEGFYESFLPIVHSRLLDGYSKIFQKLVNKGILIATNAGTQLGIVREGNIIKWDDDMDFVMDIKDFNKHKWQITSSAIANGWVPLIKNWINDDFSTYKKRGKIVVQFFHIKKLKLDFGTVTTSFYPFIDVFPGIRVDSDIKQEERENIAFELAKYYDTNIDNVTNRLLKNRKIEERTPRYHSLLKNSNKKTIDTNTQRTILQNVIRKNYKNNESTIMQLHIASPIFSNFDYTQKILKEVQIKNKKYNFIVSDNFEEQLSTEYGVDWRKPKRSHVHFFLIWFAKLKKKK